MSEFAQEALYFLGFIAGAEVLWWIISRFILRISFRKIGEELVPSDEEERKNQGC
jgi:hypothetical protein